MSPSQKPSYHADPRIEEKDRKMEQIIAEERREEIDGRVSRGSSYRGSGLYQ